MLKLQKFSFFLFTFIFLTLIFDSSLVSGKSGKSLRELYQTGKIKFIQELIITRDSFPDHIDTKLMVGYCLGEQKIYIADAVNCDIKILNLNGEFKKAFGQKGKGPGDLYLPYHLAISSDNLLVWESGNRRFSVFDCDGNFIKHFNPRYRGRVVNIKSLEDDSIIVERETAGLVGDEYKQFFGLEFFSKDLKYLKDLYKKELFGYIYLKDKRQKLIRPYSPGVYWDVLPGNKFVIGYSDKYKLEIYDTKTGKIKEILQKYTPIKVTEADKKIFFSSIISVQRSGRNKYGADNFTRKNTIFPEYKPAFKKIITDYEGNILVFTYKISPEGESKHTAKCFDAFDSTGNFINHVEIAPVDWLHLYNIVSTRGNVFWTIVEEDQSDTKIIKYKLRE